MFLQKMKRCRNWMCIHIFIFLVEFWFIYQKKTKYSVRNGNGWTLNKTNIDRLHIYILSKYQLYISFTWAVTVFRTHKSVSNHKWRTVRKTVAYYKCALRATFDCSCYTKCIQSTRWIWGKYIRSSTIWFVSVLFVDAFHGPI